MIKYFFAFLIVTLTIFIFIDFEGEACIQEQDVWEWYSDNPALYYTCFDCSDAKNIDTLGYFILHEPLIKNTKNFSRIDELTNALSIKELSTAPYSDPDIIRNKDIRLYAIGMLDDIVTIDSNGVICELGRCIQLTEDAINKIDEILVEHRNSKSRDAS